MEIDAEVIRNIYETYKNDFVDNLFIYNDHILEVDSNEVINVVIDIAYSVVSICTRICCLTGIENEIFIPLITDYYINFNIQYILCTNSDDCCNIPLLTRELSDINQIFLKSVYQTTIHLIEVNKK